MTEFIKARTDDLETRAVDGELVLLDLRTQNYLSLNQSGAHLWPLIAEGVERDRLVEALRARYELAAEVAESDVATLLAQLRKADLLQSDGHAAPTDAR